MPQSQNSGTRDTRSPVSLPSEGFCRLNQIVLPNGVLGISRALFYRWIADGRAPAPTKIGWASLWKVSDIRDLLRRIEAGEFLESGERAA